MSVSRCRRSGKHSREQGPSLAREARNGFGLLLDTARAEPVTIEEHGQPVVVVLSTGEYERLLSRPEDKRAAYNAS